MDTQNQNKFYTAYLGQRYILQNKLASYTFLKNKTFHNPRFHTEEYDYGSRNIFSSCLDRIEFPNFNFKVSFLIE